MAKIDSLLEKMIAAGASDLHLSSKQKPVVRIDGSVEIMPGTSEMAPDALSKILQEIAPESNWKEFSDCGDTDFAYELGDKGRFRCNYFLDRYGPGGVFRQIPTKIPTIEELGLPTAILDFCHLGKGLIVVTGPTGSGKSTTLAAMINYINRIRKEHIITIEDPIEFVHSNNKCLINQREVGRHTQGFKKALRAALREDPDIVLVGEMRDLETMKIAIETAETGHLVFGTLHTTTAPSTVDRIIDQFPADQQAQIRVMLSESLKGVVAQTLCKKKGGGRVAAFEILAMTSGISANIREGKTHQIKSSIQTGGKYGMRLFNDSLLELVLNDLVEPIEAYKKCVEKEDLEKKLQAKGIKLDRSKLAETGDAPPPQPNPPAALPAEPKKSIEADAVKVAADEFADDPFAEFK